MRLGELADRQEGVVSRAQLRVLGFDRGGIAHRLARKRLRPHHRGVYLAGHATVTPRARIWAAVLATDGVASHRSAGWLRQVLPLPAAVDVTVTGNRRAPRGVRVHRGALPAAHVTTLDGLPVTTVPRMYLDLADVLTQPQLENALHEGEVQRLDFGGLHELIASASGRRGMGQLRCALVTYSDGPLRSALEEAFAEILAAAALPRPVRNASVHGELLDFYWPGLRLNVELDSLRFHATPRKMASDRARDRRLRRHGVEVVRFMWSDVTQRREVVLDDLCAAARMCAS